VDHVDCVVVGAGVVGLAVARALALQGREVLIIESEEAFGTHTSSRNSEVIHAGIYYPRDSLKAKLCVQGKHLLYQYCEDRGIAHKRIGKLVVATDESEIDAVKQYISKASDNGVKDLKWLTADEVRDIEPDINSVGAVFSPSTGIIDSHNYMLSLLGDAENSGAMLACNTAFAAATITDDRFVVRTQGEDSFEISSDVLINSAGLKACHVAAHLSGFSTEHIPKPYYAKAHYYTLSGKNPFKHLIYPVAHTAFLGVHVTLDIGGQARFGPDLEWVENIDYAFDDSRIKLFYDAIKRYWPNVKLENLNPGYTGIRPKISGPQDPAADFLIQSEAIHGVKGLVNLFGIESPGLTSSLAIAEMVKQLLFG